MRLNKEAIDNIFEQHLKDISNQLLKDCLQIARSRILEYRDIAVNELPALMEKILNEIIGELNKRKVGEQGIILLDSAKQYLKLIEQAIGKAEQHVPLIPDNLQNSRLYTSGNDYNKHNYFTGGLAASQFQVTVILDFLLQGVEQVEQGRLKDFKLKSEEAYFNITKTEHPAFDDVVIEYTYPNDRKQLVYIQLKHGYYKGSQYTPKDFVNKEGEAYLKKYLDDWIIKNQRKLDNQDKHTVHILYSNRTLANSDRHHKGFQECFESEDVNIGGVMRKLERFHNDFAYGEGPFQKNNKSKHWTCSETFSKDGFRQALFDSMKYKPLHENDDEESWFLERLLYFQFGQEHIEDLEKSIQKRIVKRYRHVNADAIFHAFLLGVHQWLRAEKGQILNYASTKVSLREWELKYLELGERTGATENHLRAIEQNIPKTFISIEKKNKDFCNTFLRWIKEKNFKIFVLQGRKNSGKSTLVAQALRSLHQQGLKTGLYLFWNKRDLDEKSYRFLENYKQNIYIFIDQADQLSDQEIKRLKESGKKIIFIAANAARFQDNEQCIFKIEKLSAREIKDELEKYKKVDHYLRLGSKSIKLTSIIEHPETGIFNVLQEPQHLSAILEDAQATKSSNSETTKPIFIKPEIYVELGSPQKYKENNKFNRIVVISPSGSGKTYCMRQLRKDCLDDATLSKFSWVVIIPLNRLTKQDAKEELSQLVKKFLKLENLKPWQKEVLIQEMQTGNILYVLDGWSSLNLRQQKIAEDIIKKIEQAQSPHVVLVSSAHDPLPFETPCKMTLKDFEQKNIEQYLNDFFHSDPVFATKVYQLLLHDPIVELAQLPLQCQIICEEIAQSSKITDSKERIPMTNLNRLYQKLILIRFERFLVRHESVDKENLVERENLLIFSDKMLRRMQLVAFKQLLSKNKNLSPNKTIDKKIQNSGLIQLQKYPAETVVDYKFIHSTYTDYLAALYLAQQLTQKTKREKAISLIKSQHNIKGYEDIWLFLAGLVSFENSIYPAINKTPKALESFWEAICASLETSAIKTSRETITKYLTNSNQERLKKELPQIWEKIESFYKNNNVVGHTEQKSMPIETGVEESKYKKAVAATIMQIPLVVKSCCMRHINDSRQIPKPNTM